MKKAVPVNLNPKVVPLIGIYANRFDRALDAVADLVPSAAKEQCLRFTRGARSGKK
ncbi:MAG: hypothetical protein AAF654_13910 [Myxococcota bacterium]